MKINVVMPKMGESVTEGTIIKWHKKVGDYVKKDEILFEISTDKVDTEIPSPAEGILLEIKTYENETVPVDTVVAIIETDAANMAKETAIVKENSKVIETTKKIGGTLVDVVMPKMGESVMEGTIIKWHKKVGDYVKKDEILFEISTDKVDTEVPSPAEGVLTEIIVKENQTVEVNAVVGRISQSAGIIEDKYDVKEEIEEDSDKLSEKTQGDAVIRAKSEEEKKKKFYSPVVMNIAKAENISFEELERIEGTGIGGRVTKQDILQYINNKKKNIGGDKVAKAPTEMDAINIDREFVGREEDFARTERRIEGKFIRQDENVAIYEMDHIRQKIMAHMIKSRDTSVHVFGITEVDVTRIEKFIKSNKQRFIEEENIKLTYMPFIAYACVKALKKYPLLNASIQENKILVKKKINLGIAVAIEPNGLIVPNIKNADEKNFLGLARAINELSQKARNKKLTPDDALGGTFTITNYGVFGTLIGSPIINQPEVAILGVGAASKKPVVIEVNGEDFISIRTMMYLSLSHDHRLIDGMLGGKFLQEVKNNLENFDFDFF